MERRDGCDRRGTGRGARAACREPPGRNPAGQESAQARADEQRTARSGAGRRGLGLTDALPAASGSRIYVKGLPMPAEPGGTGGYDPKALEVPSLACIDTRLS